MRCPAQGATDGWVLYSSGFLCISSHYLILPKVSSWSRKWQPTPVFLPRESHGQRSLVDYGSWGHKELDTAEQLALSLVTYDSVGLSCKVLTFED